MSPAALSYIARHARGPLMRSQPDHRLVALVRAGSEPAFEALVARYRDPLVRYCRRILPADRAEDAVQQTFVNAHAAIADGRGGDDLRPWLYRIAHNVAVDQLRHRRGPDEQLSEELPGGELPHELVARRERLADVLTALEDLPPRQREALVLRELEGRSYDEIAFALGVGDGAVRQLLNRARNTMRSAAATLVPPAALRWAPEQLGRTAEVAGGAGATTVAAKTWIGGLIAASALGGVVAVPIVTDGAYRDGRRAPAEPREAAPVPRKAVGPAGGIAVVATQVAVRPDAPQSGVPKTERSGEDAAPRPVTGERERSESPDSGGHRSEPVGGGPPRHGDEGEHSDQGDEQTDTGEDGGSDGAAAEPPDDTSRDAEDHSGDTGNDDAPEIESHGEDLPEPASVDQPPDE